jgi:regulator of sigma D
MTDKVSQRAREAAASVAICSELADLVRAGHFDGHIYTQAFARFEQDTAERVRELEAALVNCGTALGEFIDTIGKARRDGSARQGRVMSREQIQTALAAANQARATLTRSTTDAAE